MGLSFADDADEFTVTMTSGDKTYYSDSGYITHTASVETSHVFNKVDWYVNGVWQSTTQGDGTRKTASFTKGYSGNGAGKHYWIRAEADSEDGRSASDSHMIIVRKNVVSYSGGGSNELGYAEISTCSWSGTTASINQYGSVNNWGSDSVNVTYFFARSVLHEQKHRLENGRWIYKVKDDGGNLYVPPEVKRGPLSVAAGQSSGCDFGDSYTLPPIDPRDPWWDAGDRARLQVRTTVDVDLTQWPTMATADYYFPKHQKK